jgi:hypothetical protein
MEKWWHASCIFNWARTVLLQITSVGGQDMKNAIDDEERSNAIEEGEFEEMEQGVSQAGMGFMMAMAGLIGVWGLACLVSAVIQTGLLGVIRGWVSAVTGI